jgi:hypothetical protein
LDFSLSRSACDIPLLSQQRSRLPSKTTQNSRSLSRCAMCSARIFKGGCPLFGFSCSFPCPRWYDVQQKQIDALTAGLQKVSAQLEASKSAPQVVNNP